MAVSYAARLKKGVQYGVCGTAEHFDDAQEVQDKVMQLAMTIKKSKHMVVHTGAGISTSCGIPDFRGPNGVWTKEKKGQLQIEAEKGNETPWDETIPSLTHMALVGLVQSGIIKYIITQNVDGLHVRSGVSRKYLSELHGNVFAERCESCEELYIRSYDIGSIGFKYTGRACERKNCDGNLKDVLLDWDDALPEEDLELAYQHAHKADLALCLGTSLRVQPANSLPVETVKRGGKLVICNLQNTPKDKKADLVIHAKCDEVMKLLMQKLELPIPQYRRVDKYKMKYWNTKHGHKTKHKVLITSFDGARCPFVKTVELGGMCAPVTLDNQPFQHEWTTEDEITTENNELRLWIALQLNFSPKCELQTYGVQMKIEPDMDEQEHAFEVTTVVVNYDSGIEVKKEVAENHSIHRMETRKRKQSHFKQDSYS